MSEQLRHDKNWRCTEFCENDVCAAPHCDDCPTRLVTVRVGGSTHTRTAAEWVALARADLSTPRTAVEDIERRMVDMIRYIGVKAGVPEATYGAMCHEARSILRNAHLDYGSETRSAVEQIQCKYCRDGHRNNPKNARCWICDTDEFKAPAVAPTAADIQEKP